MEIVAGLVVVLLVAGGGILWVRTNRRDKLLLNLVDAFRLGDGETGERLLGDARNVFTTTAARLRLAEHLYEARAYQHSLAVIEVALEAAPNHPHLVRLRARAAARVLRADAIDLLRDWLEGAPADARVILDLAQVYYQYRRHKELVQVLGRYVEAHPDSREAQSLLGRGYFQEGMLDEAAQHLTLAQELRGYAARHRMPVYNLSVPEYELTNEELAQAEDDARLLEQIADGSARARVAVDATRN